MFNNIFYYSVSPGSSVINYFQGGTPVSYLDYNGLYASGTMAGSHNVTTDPQLTTASALVAGSSARNAAGVITLTANAGNRATALTVNSTSAFWPGDSITVGGTAATISTINSSTSITLASPISWTNGAPGFGGARRDLGALPYRAGGYGYDVSISSPTGSVAQGNVTITAAVTNPAVVRFVEFRVDGLPLSTDSTAPFTAVWNTAGLTGTHTIEARAYPLYAEPASLVFKRQSIVVSVGNPTAGSRG